nr:uncharacterized protein LOC104111102 [Nicotiana tomentosiformis]
MTNKPRVDIKIANSGKHGETIIETRKNTKVKEVEDKPTVAERVNQSSSRKPRSASSSAYPVQVIEGANDHQATHKSISNSKQDNRSSYLAMEEHEEQENDNEQHRSSNKSNPGAQVMEVSIQFTEDIKLANIAKNKKHGKKKKHQAVETEKDWEQNSEVNQVAESIQNIESTSLAPEIKTHQCVDLQYNQYTGHTELQLENVDNDIESVQENTSHESKNSESGEGNIENRQINEMENKEQAEPKESKRRGRSEQRKRGRRTRDRLTPHHRGRVHTHAITPIVFHD